MADYKNNFHKGDVLMKQALEKYNDGDFEGGEKDRELANKYFDMAYREVDSETGKISMLYGENRNFGIILKVIEENITPRTMATKNGRSMLKEVMNMIRYDDVLRTESKVYASIMSSPEVGDTSAYVDTAIRNLSGLGRKSIVESNDKLIRLIRKHGLNEMVDIDDRTMDLFESIDNAVFSYGSMDDIDLFTTSRDNIIEHVKGKSADAFTADICESMGVDLNDDEKALVENVMKSEDGGMSLFEECKENALDAIRRTADELEGDERESLRMIYESVDERSFVKETAIGDIAELIEITNTLK